MVLSERQQQMNQNQQEELHKRYVGILVGESTSREFRLAVAHEEIREQDIIAVDAELRKPGDQNSIEKIRIWAKVQRIERVNPLFPSEAGHELAATRTNPFDTVLSLSREMVTAVCQVLGVEPLDGSGGGKLDQLRYPPQPASSAYRPDSPDIARVVLGELQENQNRALDIACLANHPEVNVSVDGHAIVSRHLAILAMTGAGKSWTARRIIEELAKKNYPIVIFDPHGDYTGLADIESLKATRYYAQFPIFEEDSETIAEIVGTLGYSLTDTMRTIFPDIVQAARAFYINDPASKEMKDRISWLADRLGKPNLSRWGVKPDMWLIAHIAEAGEMVLRDEDNETDRQKLQDWGWNRFDRYTKNDKRTLEGIKKRAYRAASILRRMEQTNQKIAGNAEPLPTDRTNLVQYGKISVVSLAGYTSDFQATIYSLIANDIFDARVQDKLKFPVLLVLEEAHNFVPARANTDAEQNSITTTKQIAQEGRKFGVGLILISQRPSRLDETTLAMCNSFIIMRMVNPADQNFVRKVIESLGEDEAKLLPDLDKGEAILSGQLINFPVLVKMKPPESKGEREETDAFEALEKAYRESISSSDSRR
jgi:DNA helicase HerA-like ATPase